MIGKRISHFTIEKKLGEGGMGEVYLAVDTELKRNVALKFLPSAQIAHKEIKSRFKREAQAAAALNHPHIITIYEVGEFDDLMYIAMEYLIGNSLRKLIDSGRPISSKNIVSYICQICDGLENAHQSGIIHRDIKPENIIIDENDHLKIIDFGLARLKDVSRLTTEHSTVGTVFYMSPEQIRGEEIDYRTDIWSVGVMLYEMVGGRVPFAGDYDQAVFYSILNEQPQSLTALNSTINPALAEVVNKCLKKDRSERYKNIRDVKNDLNRLKTANTGNQIAKIESGKVRKHLVMSTIVVIILMVAATGYYYLIDREMFSDSAPKDSPLDWENSIAVLPFENISTDQEQEYFCDGMTEQIISSLSRINSLKVISRTSSMKFKGSGKSIPEIAQSLNVNYILEGSVRKSGNRLRVTAQLINTTDDFHVWSADYDQRLTDIFDLQDSLAVRIIRSIYSELSSTDLVNVNVNRPENLEAYEYFFKGRYYHEKRFLGTGLDETSFKMAEMFFKKSIYSDSTFAPAHTALADLYHSYFVMSAQTTSEKQKYYGLISRYLSKAFQLDSTLAYSHLVKGRLLTLENRIDDAFVHFKSATDLNPNGSWMNEGLGVFLIQRGLHAHARHYLDKAILIDPLEPLFYVNRGLNFHWQGDFVRAEADYLSALQLEPQLTAAIEQYAHLLIEKIRFEEAELYLKKLDPGRSSTQFLNNKYFAFSGNRLFPGKNIDSTSNLQLIGLMGLNEAAVDFYLAALPAEKLNKISYYWLYKTSPCYDKLREDKHFQNYLAEHKKIYEQNLITFGKQ